MLGTVKPGPRSLQGNNSYGANVLFWEMRGLAIPSRRHRLYLNDFSRSQELPMRSRTFSLSILSAGLMLGGLTLPVWAEDHPKEPPTTQNGGPANPEGRRGFPMVDRFRAAVAELKLSDEQKGKIDTMFEDAQSQLKKIREGASGERQEILKKTMEVFGKLRKEVAGVLDDGQKEQLKAKLEKLFQRGGPRVAIW